MMRTELIRCIEDTWDKLRGEGQSTMLKVEGAEAPIFLRANDAEVSFLLALPIEHGIDLKPKKYSNVTIAIEKLSPETKGIVVALTNRRFLDTFVKIAADVIGNTMGLRTTSEQSSIYGTKVNSWKNIFSRSPYATLTPEEQVGLYGELTFMKALFSEGFQTHEVIDAWKGADAEDKDFQFCNIGVEVKSSHKQDKLVKISNIRQLDPTGFSELYLYYYSFAKSNGGPTTLPAQIEDIRARLVGSPYLDVFESKLLNTGYNDADKEEYKASYTLSYEEAFIVNADFPKITKETVMPAVLDASYIVDLNVCDNNIITYNSFMEKLKN